MKNVGDGLAHPAGLAHPDNRVRKLYF